MGLTEAEQAAEDARVKRLAEAREERRRILEQQKQGEPDVATNKTKRPGRED